MQSSQSFAARICTALARRCFPQRSACDVSLRQRFMNTSADASAQRRLDMIRQLRSVENESALAKLASDPALVPHFDAIFERSKLQREFAENPHAASANSTKVPEAPISADQIPKPSLLQLQRLAVMSGMPFVGFGFLDNSLMLLAGDFFDTNLGVAFGFTTLAAAALGNMVGDVLGICLGGTVESVAMRMGVPDPGLTAEQRQLNIVQAYKTGASIIGILIGMNAGLTLGMFPLLWPKDFRLWPKREDVEKTTREELPLGL